MIDLQRGDCLELMKNIPDKSIDMILCDLPYGTTKCKWDSIIPFEPLWNQYNRIIKKNKEKHKPQIDCFSLFDKNLYINYLGDIIPCCFTHEELLIDRDKLKIPNIYRENFEETFYTFFKDWYSNKIYATDTCLEVCSNKLKYLRR